MKSYLALIIFWGCTISFSAQTDSASVPNVQGSPVHADPLMFKNPEFPGGHQAFARKIQASFHNTALIKLNITKMKAIATFVVETDGSMSNIKMESYENEIIKNEFIRALKMITTKWTPGEQDGKKVRMMMRQPLIFYLE